MADLMTNGGFNRPSLITRINNTFKYRFQKLIDSTTLFPIYRWIFTAIISVIYVVRVWFLAGWHIISYALAIYILNLLIGFLTPQNDPETEGTLPMKSDDEFKTFIPKLPEFKFWYATTKAFVIAIACTFVQLLNVPVFWPILLLYFLALFIVTIKKQVKHMITYQYVPFTTGKRRYRGRTPEKADTKN